MTTFPQVSPRHQIVAAARFKISTAINEANKEGLTCAELAHILSEELVSLTSWAIREEREPSQENRP